MVFNGPDSTLDWQAPCQIPAENELPFEPPMYFCSPHFQVLTDVLHEHLVEAGRIIPGLLGGPGVQSADGLEEAYRMPDLGQGE